MKEFKPSDKNLHSLVIGTFGEGMELKTVQIWCEKEFGLKVPHELINDNELYTHKEVWHLLDQFGIGQVTK